MGENSDADPFVKDLTEMRRILLAPLGIRWDAPVGVALALFGFSDAVVQNYNDSPAPIRLEFPGKPLRIAAASDPSLEIGTVWDGERVVAPHAWVHLRV
jgi:hypothetical protein